jgi:hypothetical protein
MANLADHLLNYRWHPKNITQLRKDILADSANHVRASIINHSFSYQLEENENKVMNLISDRRPISLEDIKMLEGLFLKLINKNREIKYYNQQTLQNLFFHHWLSNCFRMKEISLIGKIKIFLSSELFKISSLIQFISWRNFRSFSSILLNQ